MKAHILVVEDESIVQLDLQNRLRRLGHVVIGSAASGEEAVAKAAELQPDLVLMDVRLEGIMDGIEAAAKIQAARDVPVLFLSAHTSGLGDRQLTAFHPHITKPFRAAELQAAIEKALNHSETDHPSQAEQSDSI